MGHTPTCKKFQHTTAMKIAIAIAIALVLLAAIELHAIPVAPDDIVSEDALVEQQDSTAMTVSGSGSVHHPPTSPSTDNLQSGWGRQRQRRARAPRHFRRIDRRSRRFRRRVRRFIRRNRNRRQIRRYIIRRNRNREIRRQIRRNSRSRRIRRARARARWDRARKARADRARKVAAARAIRARMIAAARLRRLRAARRGVMARIGSQRGSRHKTTMIRRGYVCPTRVSKGNRGRHRQAQDTFSVKQCGRRVTVTRTDRAGANGHGWGMNLYFYCRKGKARKCGNRCRVKAWGKWGSCSKPCGGGRQFKHRTLVKGTSKACKVKLTMSKPCNIKACPLAPGTLSAAARKAAAAAQNRTDIVQDTYLPETNAKSKAGWHRWRPHAHNP